MPKKHSSGSSLGIAMAVKIRVVDLETVQKRRDYGDGNLDELRMPKGRK